MDIVKKHKNGWTHPSCAFFVVYELRNKKGYGIV